MMNEISERYVSALAAVGHEIRAGWDERGIAAAIRTAAKAKHCRDDAHLAIAVIKAAADVTNRNPGVIPLDGEHWAEKAREPERRITVGAEIQTCPRCGARYSEPESEHSCARRSTPESREAAKARGRGAA